MTSDLGYDIIYINQNFEANIAKTEIAKTEESGMKAPTVRLTGISIQNFKNVSSGSLSFINQRKKYKASILGLYGQNGSGKTTLIDAIELLQYALSGMPFPSKFADYINIGSETASIIYEFTINLPEITVDATYQIVIQSMDDPYTEHVVSSYDAPKKVHIIREVIKCPILSENQPKMGRLIDTDGDILFSPIPKRSLLVGNKREITDLIVAKKTAEASSRSFIFSKELIGFIHEKLKAKENEHDKAYEIAYYSSIISALIYFGSKNLFVVNTINSGLISMNTQPFMFKYEEENSSAFGTMMLNLDVPMLIDHNTKYAFEKIVDKLNIVLPRIIPGLTIGTKDIGTELLKNGNTGYRIQLVSKKNSKEIALKYESEGIKKIVSILQLLIVVYNEPSITVAIDELDSGVFEYLLGEMLRIISEKGKGQLIFTSHNLRPLETLDRGFIAFTTTNPNNRYIRLTNVKDNNNLRDFYYRDIMLGEQDEELYDSANCSEIALAFREAGEHSGS